LQGDYYVGHSYSWTEFDIDAATQQLRVTTYGVNGYTEAEILENPEAINDLTPTVLSEFIVNPQLDNEPEPTNFNPVFGTLSNDNLDITGTNNLVLAGAGDDNLNLTNSNGNNRIYGGASSDLFSLATDVTDTIADFEVGRDLIGIANADFDSITITQSGNDAIISFSDQDLAVLIGIDAENLSEASFVFS
jgi:3-phytase/alkaline phosphatase D